MRRKIEQGFFAKLRFLFPTKASIALMIQLFSSIAPAQAAEFSSQTQAQIQEIQKETKDTKESKKISKEVQNTINKMFNEAMDNVISGKIDLAATQLDVVIELVNGIDNHQKIELTRYKKQLLAYKNTTLLQQDANIKGVGWFVLIDTPKSESHSGFQAHIEYFEVIRIANGVGKKVSEEEFEQAIIKGNYAPDSKEMGLLWTHIKDIHETRKEVHL